MRWTSQECSWCLCIFVYFLNVLIAVRILVKYHILQNTLCVIIRCELVSFFDLVRSSCKHFNCLSFNSSPLVVLHPLQQSTTLSRNQLQRRTVTSVTELFVSYKVHFSIQLYSIVVLIVRCLQSCDHHISIVTSCRYLPQVDRARLITSGRGSDPPSRGDQILLHMLSYCSHVSLLNGKIMLLLKACFFFLGRDSMQSGRRKSFGEYTSPIFNVEDEAKQTITLLAA
jgi:hypothetical protein